MSRLQAVAWLAVAAMGALPSIAWSDIEEIVVTTRKKSENLQDVPIAVSAITAEQIERQGVADLNDIVKGVTSVQFDTSYGPSDTRITIRGLSNTRGRSNVAFLVDNIDVTTENLIVAGSGLLANRRLLNDVERIEIVKGPQSALYGRAAFAGAINYITKEPSDVFESMGRIDFANDGFQEVDGAVSGPIYDTLGMRLTGFWYNQDGHYANEMSGQDVGGSGGNGFALTTVWRPNEVAKFKLRGEYSTEDYDPFANVRVGGGWQEGQSVKLLPYPAAVSQYAYNMAWGVRQYNIAHANDPGFQPVPEINALGFNKDPNGSTGLLDFNQYCPDSLKNTNAGPGLCLPTTFGSANGRVVKQSENPLTGRDFDGTDLQTFRLSLIATFDMDGGLVTSLTGWTSFTGHDNYDQDWQAEADYKFTPPGGTPANYPATPSPDYYNGRRADQLTSAQIANTDSTIHQMSEELRFDSKLDGPFQYTIGALYWDEVRKLDDQNAIMACMPLGKIGQFTSTQQGVFTYPSFVYTPGVCDGTADTVIGWQEEFRQVQPQPAAQWEADTRHWSFYTSMSWEFADAWQLVFEDRLVSERFRLLKPNQSTCTELGFLAIINQRFYDEDETGIDVVCPLQTVQEGGTLPQTNTLRTLEGSNYSHYTTPKVTLNWRLTPDNLLYAYWAKGQKPGGINTLTAGGSAATLDTEEFDPEKLTAWEFGSKNTLDLFGPMQANIALFFQDYTDKQVTTQVVENGVSQPRVLNASGAEIWGTELELQWQPQWVDGLLLSASYTYLDARYTDFVDNVTSVQRLAYSASAGRDCTLTYLGRDGKPYQFTDAQGNPVDFNPAQFGNVASVSCAVDYSGAYLERTPKHAVALGANYTRPITDEGMDFLAEVNAAWQSKRYLDSDNGMWFDPYWNVDVLMGLTNPRYEIIAYVNNVLDDDTIRSGGSGPDFARQVAETAFTGGLGVSQYFGTLPDPRIFGIRATYRFSGN